MRRSCFEKKEDAKGSWSKQEDKKLLTCIHKNGEGYSKSLPQAAAGVRRCCKCHHRGNFGKDEEDLIVRLHALLGNRWSLIAGRLPGRTDIEVKSYWNSHLRKKIMMGHDPYKPHVKRISSATKHAEKAAFGFCETSQSANSNAIVDDLDFPSANDPENIISSTVTALNLDLTLSTPPFYPTGKGGAPNVSDHDIKFCK